LDVTEEEPQVITDVYDTAETLPDGELAKKRVKTTGQRRLTTERKLITGQLDDQQITERLQSPERQTGLNCSLIKKVKRPNICIAPLRENLTPEALQVWITQLLPCKVTIPAFHLVNIHQTAAPWLVVATI